jgi:hypothetical protein
LHLHTINAFPIRSAHLLATFHKHSGSKINKLEHPFNICSGG